MPLLLAPGVDGDGDDDDDAADDVPDERVDLQLVEDAVQHGEQEHAADGPDDAAATARQRGAAEHDGRDRLEVVAAVGADGRGAGLRREARKTPAMTAASEHSTCATMIVRSVRTPDSLATSSSPPTAYTR